MTHQELKTLRKNVKFSMDDMALCIGVPKSTYQRYEDGTAAIPARIERAALEIQNINTEFIANLPARVDSAARM